MNDPLIVTAALDPDSTRLFQHLRDLHFPARLNIVPAHLTLFHHLPGSHRESIASTLESSCGEETVASFTAEGLRFLGRGVAYEIDCPPLVAMRHRLAQRWQPWLTAQDRQGFRPHVTVQNKVDPKEARSLFERLRHLFEPVNGTLIGLDLWIYRGGPWEAAGQVRWPDA